MKTFLIYLNFGSHFFRFEVFRRGIARKPYIKKGKSVSKRNFYPVPWIELLIVRKTIKAKIILIYLRSKTLVFSTTTLIVLSEVPIGSPTHQKAVSIATSVNWCLHQKLNNPRNPECANLCGLSRCWNQKFCTIKGSTSFSMFNTTAFCYWKKFRLKRFYFDLLIWTLIVPNIQKVILA